MKMVLLLFVLPVFISSFNITHKTELTDAERKFAVDHLNQTRTDLINSVKGLSEAQLNFKPAPDRWSVLECVQHIILNSPALFAYQQSVVKMPNDSNFKASFSDEQFIRDHRGQKP